jgi:hypothetical protein
MLRIATLCIGRLHSPLSVSKVGATGVLRKGVFAARGVVFAALCEIKDRDERL